MQSESLLGRVQSGDTGRNPRNQVGWRVPVQRPWMAGWIPHSDATSPEPAETLPSRLGSISPSGPRAATVLGGARTQDGRLGRARSVVSCAHWAGVARTRTTLLPYVPALGLAACPCWRIRIAQLVTSVRKIRSMSPVSLGGHHTTHDAAPHACTCLHMVRTAHTWGHERIRLCIRTLDQALRQPSDAGLGQWSG
ncbi:hypothetical protein RB593_004497 [Gaeumannomyces tritici]